MIVDPNEHLMIAGIVGSARGLQGEVNVQVRTDSPDVVFQVGASLSTNSELAPEVVVSSVRNHNGRVLLCFEGFTSREEVEELRGAWLLVEAHDEDDAWYEKDLIGLRVEDPHGVALGQVSGLIPSPAHDLLIVKTPGEEVLVPFVEAMVPQVLVNEGRVVVDAPEGLFPDLAASVTSAETAGEEPKQPAPDATEAQ